MWALAWLAKAGGWALRNPVLCAALFACTALAGIAAWRGHELKGARAELRLLNTERDAMKLIASQRAQQVADERRKVAALVAAAQAEKDKRYAETDIWQRDAAARNRDLWLCKRTASGGSAVPGVRDDPAGEASPDRGVSDGPVGPAIADIISDGERYRLGLAQCYATLDANR